MVKFLKSLNNKKTFLWYLTVFNLLIFSLIKFFVPLSGSHLADILQIKSFDSRDIIVETNKVRAEQNLSPLSVNYELDLAAENKLNDMIAKGYFAHNSPSGTTPWYWFTQAGYKYQYAGENLALGFDTASATVGGWMNSPSHRENLLNPNYQEIGVAVKQATLNGVSGVLVVQEFGKQLPVASAPTQKKVSSKSSPKTVTYVAPITKPVLVSGADTVEKTDAPVSNTAKNQTSKSSLPVPTKTTGASQTFVYYLGILTLALVGVQAVFGFRKRLLFVSGLNVLIIILVVFVPVMHFSSSLAYIF